MRDIYKTEFGLMTYSNDEVQIINEEDIQPDDQLFPWYEVGPEPELIFEVKKRRKLKQLSDNVDAALSDITNSYPVTEISSWDKQEQEAILYAADDQASVPFITAIANARNISVGLLATKILSKASIFAATSGSLFGKRHLKEQLILDATTQTELDSIDINL